MRKKILYASLVFTSISIFNFSCQKDSTQILENELSVVSKNNNNGHGHLKQAKTFGSDLVIKWLDMQLDMLRVPLAPGTGSQGSDRSQSYCGIATYEAVVNGMPGYQSLYGQLTDFPEMPKTEPGKAYHWAASANAALAEMNRKLFPTTSDVNKTNINNLENNLQSTFAGEVTNETLQRSIAFGKEVATRVLAWAATDGSTNINAPYVPLVGPGLWVPTSSNPPINPYASQRRLLVPGVANGTALEPPPMYSNIAGSAFWEMAKDVYEKSLALTPDQTAIAIYNRDAPGYPGGGHFVSVLSQVITKAQPALDVAALAYVKVGLVQNDAGLICFINKYNYKLLRPITYIRNEMGHSDWSPLIPTPNHPEFPAAHAVISAAVAEMLTDVFGANFKFSLHTYDYLGMPARNFNSFYEMSKEMGDSRVYAGIHYQASVDKGNKMGKKVGANILNTVKFHK